MPGQVGIRKMIPLTIFIVPYPKHTFPCTLKSNKMGWGKKECEKTIYSMGKIYANCISIRNLFPDYVQNSHNKNR